MSILKNKKIGLSALLLVAVLSLTLAFLLPVIAENGSSEETYFTLTVKANDPTMGTVKIEGSYVDENDPTRFLEGSTVTITAKPSIGYQFERWSYDGSYSESATITKVVEKDLEYTAIFSAEQYKIHYPLDDPRLQFSENEEKPKYHVYGYDTELPTPGTPAGYTFVGWQVVCDGREERYEIGESLGKHDFKAEIWLYPIFEENKYDVICRDYDEWGTLLGERRMEFEFGTSGADIPVEKWGNANLYSGYTHDPEQYQTLKDPVTVNTSLNVVKRIYKSNQYTVKLDKGADNAEAGTASVEVTFARPFPASAIENPPTRTGYAFVGYYHDKNNNNKHDSGEKLYCSYGDRWTYENWDLAQDNVTLKAKWERRSFALKLDFGGKDHWISSITIFDKHNVDENNQRIRYNYNDPIPYNTEVEIVISVVDGHKLTKWRGEDIRDTSEFSYDFTIPGENTTIAGVLMEEIPDPPEFWVNYPAEELAWKNGASIPAGRYRLETADGEIQLAFSVAADGVVSFTKGDSLSIAKYLGKDENSVFLIECGDDTIADSDPQEIELAPRPTAPDLTSKVIVKTGNKTVKIDFLEEMDISGLEFACSEFLSETDDGSDLTWQTSPEFSGLKDGTPHYVYIRVAATESAPHGYIMSLGAEFTDFQAYVQECIDTIVRWMREGIVGPHVTAVIDNAKAELNALKPSGTFYGDANAIVSRVEEELKLARPQDQAIADLTARYNELVDSKRYGENLGLPQLKTLYDKAIVEIGVATTTGQLDEIVLRTKKDFDLVPVSYLYAGDQLVVYAEKGIDREYAVTAKSQIDSMATIAAKIQKAINAGTLVPGGTMKYTDIKNALKTMDVLGYYLVKLDYKTGAEIHHPAQGPYEVRLLLPEDLRDDTGLMVAYYNENTEELTVLDTEREGNWLIFKVPQSQSVENFVILGDHAVNMVWICLMLSLVVLAQMIAILVILVRRRKFKMKMRMNAWVLPTVALTVRFFPIPVAKAVVILAGAVVLLQIVLMALLVKTDLVPRGRRSRRTSDAASYASYASVEAESATAWSESSVEDEAAFDGDVAVAEELDGYEIENDEVISDGETYAEDESVIYDSETPDGESVPEVFAEEWYDDEDFVESDSEYATSEEDSYYYEEEAAEGEAYDGEEDPNGYSMEYDENTNDYQLAYDNEPVEYTEAEFDGEGEGFVDDDDSLYGEDAEELAYAETEDYGYDVEPPDESEVVYDYVTAEDVVRDEDYDPGAEDSADEDF